MRKHRSGWRGRLTAFYFRKFFSLLMVLVSIAEWACVAWVLAFGFGFASAPWAHLLGVVGIYTLNGFIVRLRSARLRRGPGLALRVYTAAAFTSLFCFAFMLASGIVWVGMRTVVGTLSAQALTQAGQTAIGDGLDGTFQWLVSLGMLSIGLTMGYGYVFGHRELSVNVIRLPLTNGWPRGIPFRIAQISDIHVGQNLGRRQLSAYVERVNAANPDLICITGDITDSPHADVEALFPVLGRLKARYGVVAILGNHDHYAGADRVVEQLRRWTAFRVLRDEAVTVEAGEARLHVIGLDDRGRDWARGVRSDARLTELIADAPPAIPVLLLAHRPDLFDQAAAAGVVLTLSGHTHGGQLALPWFGGQRRNLAQFVTRYDRGLYRRGSSSLYVNCGLGVTAQRIRLFTPREISIFDIHAA
jgi:predicted MPP superfamily phosphohydrolase